MILVPCKPVSVLEQAFAFTNTNHPVQHNSFELATDSTWEFVPWQSRDEDATSSRLANELQLTPASGLADWRDDISPRAPPCSDEPCRIWPHLPSAIFPSLSLSVMMGGATVSEDKSPGGLCGPLRTRSGAGWQAEGQGFDFDFVLSLSLLLTGRSLFVESIHDVIKHLS